MSLCCIPFCEKKAWIQLREVEEDSREIWIYMFCSREHLLQFMN